jgi:hypothetical protein
MTKTILLVFSIKTIGLPEIQENSVFIVSELVVGSDEQDNY